ncbi:malonyl-[acyl-carrier protein] O-methyltransferase BioC, partial [Pseudomonas stutzeri]|nr:malonyl-[acyl-carrier protein] O-methyltransferase BioC [Stutzerimonas degradans]
MTESSLGQRPTGVLPDKRQVAASFSRAAASYDSVAALQRRVGGNLLAALPEMPSPTRWLDLGSGTGYFSRALAARFPQADGVALDIA